MLRFPVSLAKAELLLARMQALGIKESDLTEKFIRGSGAGGQKINKTSSTVYLKHGPSGLEVKCQETRQLSLNRYYARQRLCDLLEAQQLGKESKRSREIYKTKKQKARRHKKAKEKMLKEKGFRSETKILRRAVKE